LEEQVLIMSGEFMKARDFLCKCPDDLKTGGQETEKVLNMLGMMDDGLTVRREISLIKRWLLILENWKSRHSRTHFELLLLVI